jgi:hypothetical protein
MKRLFRVYKNIGNSRINDIMPVYPLRGRYHRIYSDLPTVC